MRYEKEVSFPSVRVCVIPLVCLPLVIESKGPSSPSEAHSKTTAMIDTCRRGCRHKHTHAK